MQCKKMAALLLLSLIGFCSLKARSYKKIKNLTNSTQFRVGSYNIRRDEKELLKKYKWNNRKKDVSSLILDFKPDIIGFQEALFNQVNDLQSMLGSNYAWFGRGREEVEKGGVVVNPNAGEFAPLFYNKNNFALMERGTLLNPTLMEGGTFWLNPTKAVGQKGWGAANTRICTWGKFKSKKSGIILWVYNVHLDHKSKEAQKEGTRLVVEEILRRNGRNVPVILMGDFNNEIKKDSPSGKTIFNPQYRMYDTRQLAQLKIGVEGTAFAGPFKDKTKLGSWLGVRYWTIDYIFVNNPNLFNIVQQLYVERDDKRISDHNAVFIDFYLRDLAKEKAAKSLGKDITKLLPKLSR